MKLTTLAFLGSSIAFLHVNALALEKRDAPAVVSVPFIRNPSSASINRKRASNDLVTLQNENLLYTASLKIGTPPQLTRVQIDTGSSFLIVETDSSNLCVSDPTVCSIRGAYDANSSTTNEYLNSDLVILYGGGDGATGDFCYDVLTIDGTTIPKFRFGIMYQTTVQEGVFGISYPSPELSDGSIASVLVANGNIPSRAYSLWLNDDRAAAGELLFGGVDTEKFKGNLVTIDLVPRPGQVVVDSFLIPLLDVTVTKASGTTVPIAGGTSPGSALLDSGTTFSLFPAAISLAICTALDGDCSGSSYFVACTLADTAATVNLIFEGITIHVQLRQFMLGSVGVATQCQLGLGTYADGIILGDTALSSMYIVYDMDNNQVSLAETIFDTSASNILQILPGPNGVPNAPGVGGSTIGLVSSSTSTVLTSSSTVSPSSADSTSTSAEFASPSVESASPSNGYFSAPDGYLSASDGYLSASDGYFSASAAIASASADITLTSADFASSTTTSSPTFIPPVVIGVSSSTTTPATIATTKPAVPAPACARNNCFRAILRPSVAPFCSSYLAGVPVATPANVSKGCKGLASRISSGCSCLPTA